MALRSTRFYLKGAFGGFLCILLVFFIYRQARDVRTGGTIAITKPADGATLFEPLVTVAGTAKKISFMYLNGRQIFSDENGLFEESLLLAPGYTIITLSAQHIFERKREERISVVYVPPSTHATSTEESSVVSSSSPQQPEESS